MRYYDFFIGLFVLVFETFALKQHFIAVTSPVKPSFCFESAMNVLGF